MKGEKREEEFRKGDVVKEEIEAFPTSLEHIYWLLREEKKPSFEKKSGKKSVR